MNLCEDHMLKQGRVLGKCSRHQGAAHTKLRKRLSYIVWPGHGSLQGDQPDKTNGEIFGSLDGEILGFDVIYKHLECKHVVSFFSLSKSS